MKKSNKFLTAIIMVILFICTMSIFVSAAFETKTLRNSYSIPIDSSKFNADKQISYALDDVETRLNISVDNPESCTVTAKVYQWRKYQKDQLVLTVNHTGNTYNSGYFVPDAAYPYYVVITTDTTDGVDGHYSFDQIKHP